MNNVKRVELTFVLGLICTLSMAAAMIVEIAIIPFIGIDSRMDLFRLLLEISEGGVAAFAGAAVKLVIYGILAYLVATLILKDLNMISVALIILSLGMPLAIFVTESKLMFTVSGVLNAATMIALCTQLNKAGFNVDEVQLVNPYKKVTLVTAVVAICLFVLFFMSIETNDQGVVFYVIFGGMYALGKIVLLVASIVLIGFLQRIPSPTTTSIPTTT